MNVQDPVASRYAEALFNAAKAQDQVEPTLKQLTLLGRLFDEQPSLRQFLGNPDVEPEDKVGVLERVLGSAWSDLLGAFVRLVLSLGRVESLRAIVDAFQAAVDEDRRLTRAVVRSVHPLPEALLERLRSRLEALEDRTVELRAELDPTLLGGLQIRLGNRVIDGSVRRQLDDLRRRLKAVRVHDASPGRGVTA